MKKSFSLLEIVFVIVVIGVIGLISSDITKNLFLSYEEQKEFDNAEFLAKIIIKQIEARLKRAIFDSITDISGNDLKTLHKDNNKNFFQWIDKDIEGLRGIWNGSFVAPIYSGFANLEQSNDKTIKTSDSNLMLIDSESIYMDLTGSNELAIYFPYANSKGIIKERFYNGFNSESLFGVAIINQNTLNIKASSKRPYQIGELYYLTNSAIAIEFFNGNLYLYDNYRPWLGESYINGRRNLLAENVESFEFWGESLGTIARFRVCIKGSSNSDIIVCKEGAVSK